MKAKPAKRRGEVVLEVNRRDEPLLAAANPAAASSPFRIKQILVPIDFSDCAKKALQYALPLAKQHGAGLTLLYVVQTPPYASGEYGVIDQASLQAEMCATGKKQLTALTVDEVQEEVSTSAMVRTGAPAVEIVDVAKTLPADIIVISTHGRTGLKHVLLGSVVEQVVRRAPCPVLVVREREHELLAT